MKKGIKIVIFVVLIVIIAVVVFVRVRGYKKEVEYIEDTIKVGVSLPLTLGGISFFSEGALGGVRLAQKEINEKGGIFGKKIELVVKDDTCLDREKAVEVWNELINEEKVLAILGPVCDPVAEEGIPLAQKSKTLVLMGGNSMPWITKFGNYIFNSYPNDVLNGKFIADYLFTELNRSKVAIIRSEEEEMEREEYKRKVDFPEFFRERFERYKELGAEIVFDKPFLVDSEGKLKDDKPEEEVINSAIEEIKRSGAEAIHFFVILEIGHKVVKAIQELNLNLIVIGAEYMSLYPEFEGALFSVPKINLPEEFQDRVSKVHQGSIEYSTSVYYDNLHILAQAIERAGKLDRELIRDELAKTSYRGVAFPIVEFDDNGDLKEAEFEIMVIKNGKTEPYLK